jgi:hypothetical protein
MGFVEFRAATSPISCASGNWETRPLTRVLGYGIDVVQVSGIGCAFFCFSAARTSYNEDDFTNVVSYIFLGGSKLGPRIRSCWVVFMEN